MSLHFQKVGSGPPLILLHGLLGSLDNLLPVARPLASHFTLYAVDLRNHGQSHHSPEFNYAVMVQDLVRFCDEHRLSGIHLLGHSMGGKTAMHFALGQPAKVERLVVVDIAPRAYPPRHDVLLDALLAMNLDALGTRAGVETALQQVIPDGVMRKFLLKNLRHDAAQGVRWRMNLRGIRENYTHLNTAVPVGRAFLGPVLFIRGGRSDYITVADRAEIELRFPQVELRTIPEAGHWVHADAPVAFTALLQEFLLRSLP